MFSTRASCLVQARAAIFQPWRFLSGRPDLCPDPVGDQNYLKMDLVRVGCPRLISRLLLLQLVRKAYGLDIDTADYAFAFDSGGGLLPLTCALLGELCHLPAKSLHFVDRVLSKK